MKATARKSGGPTKGDSVEAKDIKNKEMKHSEKEDEVHEEADAMHAKKGGKVKKQVGGPVGSPGRKHGGRAARAGGGSCESSPFSSARAGTAAPGRKLQKTTMD
jgi:hypothetical protein